MTSTVKGIDEVLDEIPFGRFHVLMIMITGAAYIADGYVANMIGFSSECIGDEFQLEESDVAKFPIILFSGSITGTFAFAQIADASGRRFAILLMMAWIILSCLIISLLGSSTALMYAYFLLGFATGGTGIAFNYISEVVGPNLRVLGFVIQTLWPISTTIVSLLGWWILGGGGSWRTLMQALTIPALLAFIFTYYMMPESARWLLRGNEFDKAEDLVRMYAKMNGTHLDSFSFSRGMLKDTEREEQQESVVEGISGAGAGAGAGAGSMVAVSKTFGLDKIGHGFSEFARKMTGIFSDPEARSTVLLMSYMFFNSCLSFYGSVFLQARLLKRDKTSSNGTCDFDFSEYLLSAPAELFSALIVVFTTDMQGRRWSMFTWAIAIALSALVLVLGKDSTTITDAALVALRFSAAGNNVATWTPATELFNTEYRATAFSLCYVMSRVGAMLSAILVDSSLEVEQICTIIAVLSCLSALAALNVRETQGESID